MDVRAIRRGLRSGARWRTAQEDLRHASRVLTTYGAGTCWRRRMVHRLGAGVVAKLSRVEGLVCAEILRRRRFRADDREELPPSAIPCKSGEGEFESRTAGG